MLKSEKIDTGKEEWLVFVHGIAGSTKTWKKQTEFFAERYNLLLLDLPGHGQNADTVIKKVNIHRLNDGIKAALDANNIEKAHFIGLSLGAIVIASFALRYPQYIKSIVFGGQAIMTTGVYKCFISAANALKRLLPYTFLYTFLSWFLLPRKNHQHSRRIFLREAVKLHKETMFAWIDYLTKMLCAENIIDELKHHNFKTFLISGREDHCFLGGVKKILAKLKGVRLHLVKNCGHICSIEKHNEFNESVLRYLTNCSR